MNYVPLAISGGVGLIDGVINPASGSRTVPHAHLFFRLFILGAGLWGSSGTRAALDGTRLQGRWNPDVAESMVAASTTLLASRIPAALTGGGISAFGDVEHGGTPGGSDGNGGTQPPDQPIQPPPPDAYTPLGLPEPQDAAWSWVPQRLPQHAMSKVA